MPLFPTDLEYNSCQKVQHNLRVMTISQYSSGSTSDSFLITQNQNLENQSEITKALKSHTELSNELQLIWEGRGRCYTLHCMYSFLFTLLLCWEYPSGIGWNQLVTVEEIVGSSHLASPAPPWLYLRVVVFSWSYESISFLNNRKIYIGLFSSNKILQDL